MFCPQCGQERLSTETSFCSRCGFLLTGTAELLVSGGLIPRPETAAGKTNSPRSKGVKTGLFIFLLALVIVPLLALVTVVFNIRTPVLPVFSMIVLVGGGILRMAYALLFESPAPTAQYEMSTQLDTARTLFNRQGSPTLPEGTQLPVEAYAPPVQGRWRTSELEPRSVTENTTKLLERDEQTHQ